MDGEAIRELFAAFGPVAIRRMFGGAGIYADGTMFALVADGVIYLKTDERTESAFLAEGLQQFTYETGSGIRALRSYRRMPDRLYDDPEQLACWAEGAVAAARRIAGRKSKSKRRSKAVPEQTRTADKRPRR